MSKYELGQRLRDRRLELGLTLEDVAQVVGVGKSTVRKWETGEIANMRRDRIALLAKALHTTPGFVMGVDDTAVLSDDDELQLYLEELKTRPEMRMLFSLAKNATKEDVEQAVKIIEALRKD